MMQLEFEKTPIGFRAQGDAGRFILVLNQNSKTWTVSLNGIALQRNIKGYSNAVTVAQNEENKFSTVKEEKKNMARIKTETVVTPIKTTATKTPTVKKETPAQIAERETAEKKAATGARLKAGREAAAKKREAEAAAIVPVKRGRPARIKETEEVVETPIVKRGRSARVKEETVAETQVTATRRTNKGNSIPEPTATTPKRRGRQTIDNALHSFGEKLSDLAYAIVQMNNARNGGYYSVAHFRKHPYSPSVKEAYLASVKRQYTQERNVYNVSVETDTALPKNTKFFYFNHKNLPEGIFVGAPEGNSVIDGYKFELKENGESVTLPIDLTKRVVKPRTK